MHKPVINLFTVFLIIIVLSLAVSAQMMGNHNIIEVKTTGEIEANGDFKMDMTWNFPDTSTYTQLKMSYPNPYLIIRDITSSRSDIELDQAEVKFNDARKALIIDGHILGYAVCRHNQWEVPLGDNASLVYRDGNLMILRQVLSFGDGMLVINDSQVQLPEEATQIRFNRNSQILSYALPVPQREGPPYLEVNINTKPRLMSAAYKAYGLPGLEDGEYWAAKVRFQNTGESNIKNLNVSYRLGQYSNWSPPHRYSLIVPTGSVIDLYYPIISSTVTSLKTPTPENMEINYSYEDEQGNKYEDHQAVRVSILGINQMEFCKYHPDETSGSWQELYSNAPLLAAFVTHLDEPVKKFAGMVSQFAGGVATRVSDQDAYAFCEALFNLEIANKMVYQTPSSFLTEYSPGQDVKYPRNVLRDKSGTCLDLAILYCSVCEAVGLKSYLAIVPGHAFPIIQLPSGSWLPVESTMIGGQAVGVGTFEKALELGNKNMQELQPGRYFFVDVQQMHQNGIVSPELPGLPPTILKDWGYSVPERQADPQQQQNNNQNVRPDQNRNNANAGVNPNTADGVYQGETRNDNTGESTKFKMVINTDGNIVTGEFQVEAGYVGNGPLQGEIYGNTLRFVIYSHDDVQQVEIQCEAIFQNGIINGNFYMPAYGYSGTLKGQKVQ